MIEFKLNGKKTEMPTAAEMTVSQYSSYRELCEKHGDDGLRLLVNYISATTGASNKVVMGMELVNAELLMGRIGKLSDYTKMKPKKTIMGIGVAGIEKVGDRIAITEHCHAFKNEELMVFVLAVAIHGWGDMGKILKAKDKMMGLPYTDILPTAFFLSKNLSSGSNSGKKNSRKSRFLTNIKRSKNRRGSKN